MTDQIPDHHQPVTNRCRQVTSDLDAYLRRSLNPERNHETRRHLDACPSCWTTWHRYRWDAARPSPLFGDLATFLGPAFIDYYDSSRRLAAEWDGAAATTPEQIRRFYADTPSYLYNQVIWHASGNRPPYLRDALPLLRRERSRTVLDYGCGIGADTLALRATGYTVIACDLDSPPTRFLRWRQARAGSHEPVHQPDALPLAPTPDTLWIIDTLDHLPDLDQLTPVLRQVRLVISEDLAATRTHGSQGFHLRRPAGEINAHLADQGLHPILTIPQSGSIDAWAAPRERPNRVGASTT
ncbi:MAG: methyltransferase domain-containing protein [Actinobacteria bacterium]|nr:methyltransferase domain-containing protein [Actinomycetota bacterium]MBI3686011.1 methyltransferase domain-containing protein [Actinomycetota bacterium]